MKYEPEKFEASGIHEVRELGMGKDLSRDICNMLNAVGGGEWNAARLPGESEAHAVERMCREINNPEKKQEFDDRMERYDMQYDKFTVGKENTVRGLEYITIETDAGIEIKIPIEEYITKENIEIVEEPGGGSTVIIRNIEQARVK